MNILINVLLSGINQRLPLPVDNEKDNTQVVLALQL